MKAARIHSFGGSDQIRLETRPEPVAAYGEVIIKVIAAGVNPIDWKIREGFFGSVLPLTLGQDFSGIVSQAGDATSRWRAGDEIFGMLPTEATGSFAEFIAVKPDWISLKPTSLSFEDAAGIPMGALTASIALFERGDVASGQRVLVHGGAGAVGGMAVQLAKAKGAWVAATASGAGLDVIRSYGVDLPIDYKTERFEEAVRAVGGVDLVVDTLAGETRDRSWSAVRDGGALVSTLGPAEPPADAKARAVRGLPGFGAAPNGRRLAEIAEMIDVGTLRPLPIQVMAFDAVSKALDTVKSGQAKAKIILRIASNNTQ